MWFLICLSLIGQDVDSNVGRAPTSFQSSSPSDARDHVEDSLSEQVGSQINDSGGFGQLKTFSLRSSPAKNVGVFLEGIRLNSESKGVFDFGELNLWGLKDITVVRGGYSPTATTPQGQVFLRLDDRPGLSTKVGYGSFNSYFFGARSPVGSLSYESSQNDFLFDNGSGRVRKENYASRNLNVRAWKKSENYQVWGQFIFSDLEDGFGGSTETITPTIAVQGSMSDYDWDVWVSYQSQSTSSGDNRLWSSGQRLSTGYKISEQFFLRHIFEVSQDELFSANYDADFRGGVSYVLSGYYSPAPGQLIHPRVRLEYASDLDEAFSVHPGIGGRHSLSEALSLLWNASYISLAPTFFDRYFEVSTASFSSIANPDLQREKTLQGDAGYEFSMQAVHLRWVQALFVSRTKDLIQFVQTSSGDFQSQNTGTGKTWGLEQELSYQPVSDILLSANYTYSRAKVESNEQTYQPRHRARFKPTLFPENNWNFAVPVYYRSRVFTDLQNTSKLGHQWDLGAVFIGKHDGWTLRLSANNLLRWRRIEVANSPLPQETWFAGSLQKDF